ncbi:MAG: hypothetical protein II864_13235 [Prevotella sp.]|nr:hypothetical protein [Prevotella sp.]
MAAKVRRTTDDASSSKVRFSQGNLRVTHDHGEYIPSIDLYLGGPFICSFATNQWDCVGNAPGNNTIYGIKDFAFARFFALLTTTSNIFAKLFVTLQPRNPKTRQICW